MKDLALNHAARLRRHLAAGSCAPSPGSMAKARARYPSMPVADTDIEIVVASDIPGEDAAYITPADIGAEHQLLTGH